MPTPLKTERWVMLHPGAIYCAECAAIPGFIGDCCLCGQTFDWHGCNPYPLDRDADAYCCRDCDQFVLAVRMGWLAVDQAYALIAEGVALRA